ncbi:hypothetical protein NMG60_11036272 [Bertholletia excelsa]
MAGGLELTCHACGNIGFTDGADGFYYCSRCGSQAEDIIDTAVAEEDLGDKGEAGGGGGIYLASHRRQRPAGLTAIKAEPLSQSQPQSKFWESLKALDDEIADRVKTEDVQTGDGVGPTGPSDFGWGSRALSYDDYYSEIRMRYVMGLQIMIQLQCKALVEKFQVSSLIYGLAGTIWLRYVAFTRIFDDNWADETIHESESQKQGQADDFKPRAKYSAEPHNIHGQRAVMIWYRSLKRSIPLSHSLAITFLACHLAREAVLPTDILKWSLEGKLPYFAAFLEIEKKIGPPSNACPLSSSLMFKPYEAVSLQKLESQAASIAKTIGLELPPVNFYAIASRYIKQLSIPLEKILPSLWLSANEFRLPTRVGVMSMVIVAIRILYDINGFGIWEKSLTCSSELSDGNGQREKTCSDDVRDDSRQGFPLPSVDNPDASPCRKSKLVQKSELEAMDLLRNLEARYNEIEVTYEFSKDLPTYLQYCKDVVFAGLEPSFEDLEEEKLINEFWDFYQDHKDSRTSLDKEMGSNTGLLHKRSGDDIVSLAKESKKTRDDMSTSSQSTGFGPSHSSDSHDSQQSMSFNNCSPKSTDLEHIGQTSTETLKDKAIRRMKSNMEENRFCYIPPRVNIKRLDYLHYVRKKDAGAYIYAAHADYYILLRSCARVAQVDIRVMHAGVLSFERRLGWLEKRIDYCLHLTPPKESCEVFNEELEQKVIDDSIDVSKLSL